MDKNNFPWINPIGGYGDMLMLSGVLKQVIEKFPEKRFNLTRRTNYVSFLKDILLLQVSVIRPRMPR